MKGRKSQSWSTDIILAVVLFMGAFFLFYSILNDDESQKVADLKDGAFQVIKQVSSSDSAYRIIDRNELNVTRMDQLKNMSYEELKAIFKIEGDFCIFMEDESGNIILINQSYKGLGSPRINISGTPCSQK